jgi:hypothetical protein
MNPDGSDPVQLSEDGVSFINVDDHYIYYARVHSPQVTDFAFLNFNTNSLCRVNLDGSSLLILDEDPVLYAALSGNTIYYIHYDTSTASTLYRVGIDGTDSTQVTSEPLLLSPGQQGTLCYSGVNQNGNISLWNPQTDTGTTIYEGITYHPVDSGDYIYYMNGEADYHLYRYDKSTGEVTEMNDSRVDCYNLTGQYLYYQKSGDSPALCRISLDGSSGEETVMSGTFTDINVTSRYVYFRDFSNEDVFYKTPADGEIQVSLFNP